MQTTLPGPPMGSEVEEAVIFRRRKTLMVKKIDRTIFPESWASRLISWIGVMDSKKCKTLVSEMTERVDGMN